MRKNRIIITLWLSVIVIIVLAMIGYIIYASIYNPYFGSINTVLTDGLLDFKR